MLACVETLRGERSTPSRSACSTRYINPDHERRIAELIAVELPDVRITLSSAIAPEPGESERSSTTTVNGFLLPVVEDYLIRLEHRWGRSGVRAPLQIMQSDGTTAGAEMSASGRF